MSVKDEAAKTSAIVSTYTQMVTPNKIIYRDLQICRGCKKLIREIFDEEIPGTDETRTTFAIHCGIDYDPTVFTMPGITGRL